MSYLQLNSYINRVPNHIGEADSEFGNVSETRVTREILELVSSNVLQARCTVNDQSLQVKIRRCTGRHLFSSRSIRYLRVCQNASGGNEEFRFNDSHPAWKFRDFLSLGYFEPAVPGRR